jgi:MFS family permease
VAKQQQVHRSMLLPVYVPTLLLAFGQGVTVYTLPLYAKALGGDLAVIGLAVAAAGVGTFLTDLPAGMLLGRFGGGRLMLIGTGAAGLSAVLIGLVHSMPALVLFRVLFGVGSSLWSLSRMAYVADVTVPAQRGRILSTFGGVNRAGAFAGPALGGLIAGHYGLASPFLVAGVAGLAAAAMSLLVAVEKPGSGTPASRRMRWNRVGLVLQTHSHDLASAGSAQFFGQIIRAGRQLIVPLYGATALGLGVEVIGVIGTIAAAIDMLMFLPSGLLMDRFGRKYASVPSFVLLSLGMLCIPFVHNAPELIAATTLMGFGNGLGSGSMMTLGTDLAPKELLGEFLGLWRLIGDAGSSAGPIIVGSVAHAVGLGSAAVALAAIGGLSAGTIAMFVRETLRPIEA